MPKPQKPAGGAKAAEPPSTPAAETPPVTEAPAVETPETQPPAPTPEEIQAKVDSIFAPVNYAENAKIQAKRAKDEADALDAAEAAPAAEEDLPQTEAPEGGEKERSEEPEPETPPATETPETPETPAERFVPQMTPEAVEETARRVAREEAENMAEEQPPAPEVPHGTTAATDDSILTYAQKKHLAAMNELAEMKPSYRDMPGRWRDFWKQNDKYIARWEQANPGQVFDIEAAEHAEFYRKHQPFVPDEDLDAAKEALITRAVEERAVARARKEQEPRIRAIELKEREREVAPHIANSMADAAEEVFAAAPQFKEAFKPKELTKDSIAKMEEINPVLAQVAQEEVEKASVLVFELEKFDRLQGYYEVDPQKRHTLKSGQVIAPRQALESEFAECEAALLAKQEVRDGKKIIPFGKAMERAQRIQADPRLRPEQKVRAMEDLHKQNWWVQAADVRNHIVAKSKARVGKFAESFAKMKPYSTKNTATNGTPPATNGKPAVSTAKPSGKANLARGTATASSSDVSDNTPRGQSEVKKAQENLYKSAFP